MSRREKIIELLEGERFTMEQRLLLSDPENREHIIQIAESCLETRSGGIHGGGFVKAIVDNNLSEAFARADYINENFIRFYVIVLYNLV
jgi:hypothetical protein